VLLKLKSKSAVAKDMAAAPLDAILVCVGMGVFFRR